MGAAPHVKVPVSLLDSGALPKECIGVYVMLCRLAMMLRETRKGDTFVAAKSAVRKALEAGHWGNAKKQLEKAQRLTTVVRWREVDDTKVEITLINFEKSQGFRQSTNEAQTDEQHGGTRGAGQGHEGGTEEARRRHKEGTGQSSTRNTTSSSENTDASRSKTQESRLQKQEDKNRARRDGFESKDFPEKPPAEVVAWTRQPKSRRWLRRPIGEFIDDDQYIRDEWALCRRYHLRTGTVPGSLTLLFRAWLKDERAVGRAHERLKQGYERAAESLPTDLADIVRSIE